MKAIIWIIVLILVIWGIWWLVHRNSANSATYNPAAAGAVQGASDTYTASSTEPGSGAFDSKG